jgi:cell division protein FtsI (penicillin-binding protein 3)
MSFLSRIMVAKSQAHFSSGVYSRFGGPSGNATIEGTRKKRSGQAKNRVGLLAFAFVCVYCVIGGRLIEYAVRDQDTSSPASRRPTG